MELADDVVIVGAGIAGLTISLGLHRLGIRSIVLESSNNLRATGFGFGTWTNAWKALDALGIGDSLRQQHVLIDGIIITSIATGKSTADTSFKGKGKCGDYEVRCVKRQSLMEALVKDLPSGTIRYSSKLVFIEESGYFKLLHLADGTVIKTKVLIGCDGINSVVAKWLGFKKPVSSGRSSIRGCANFLSNPGLGSKMLQFFGNGIRSGYVPCDGKTIYWFHTWTSSSKDKEFEDNPIKMKQFVLNSLKNVPHHIRNIVETTELDNIVASPLSYRYPWDLLFGNISKGNVCVAGDAFHPMTPDLAQGACAALEDGVVLARCLAKALKEKSSVETIEKDKEEYERIEMELRNYAKERRWRCIELISTAYMVGRIQQADGEIMNFLRDKFFSKILSKWQMKKSDFDCGKLIIS